MNNKKNIITISLSIIYFCVLNNPKFIRRFNIKMNDEHIVLYSLIYLLMVYSTYRIVNKVIGDDEIEHQSNMNEISTMIESAAKATMEKKIKTKLDKENVKGCDDIEADLLKNFMDSDPNLKKTINNMKNHPYDYKICKPDDKKKCAKLDMSKFVLKDSVPKCDYVLPEQYNLYKHRKGYTPGDPASDPTMDTIINKDNYIFFYSGFVLLMVVYILVLIFKSVF